MTSPAPNRVLIADAEPLFAVGLRAVLHEQPDFEVIGEAYDGEQTLDAVQRLSPDLLLLDLRLRDIDGLEVLRRLQLRNLKMHTVLMADQIDRQRLASAIMHGARGILLKEAVSDLGAKCVRLVMAGEYWVTRVGLSDVIGELRTNYHPLEGDYRLSPREVDIVQAVVNGASNKDVARQVGLGEQTVKNYLRHIFFKLNVSNRVELALQAANLRQPTGAAGEPRQ